MRSARWDVTVTSCVCLPAMPYDLVVWSMRDLVNHAPQAADVLREGHGTWKWDQAQRAYRRLERLGGDPRPA